MTDDVLLVERHPGLAVVTLHRPGRRNALDSALMAALPEVMAELDADPAVRAVVLTGSDPAFCAGLDLRELNGTGENLRTAVQARTTHRPGPWAPLRTPVVGAVNGPAVTGGLEVALHCDLLLASERASFADTHVRVGVLPGWGLSYLLPQAVGIRRAREMSLTGRHVGPAEAAAWGLVNRVVPHAELLDTARAVATAVAEVEPDAAAAMLDLYARTSSTTGAEAAETERAVSAAWLERSGRGARPEPEPAR